MALVIPPKMIYLGRGDFEVTNRPIYQGERETLAVEPGFRTDLASVPRVFTVVLPSNGAYEDFAVFHDWWCTLRNEWHAAMQRWHASDTWYPRPIEPPVSARDADGLFRRMMREHDSLAKAAGRHKDRIRFVTRWQLWAGVRWGAVANPARRQGWFHWKETPILLAITAADLLGLLGLAWLVHAGVELLVS